MKENNTIGLVGITALTIALLFGCQGSKEQETFSVQIHAYPSDRGNEGNELRGKISILDSVSSEDIELEKYLKSKMEEFFESKGFIITSIEAADYVVLPFYWAQKSGNDYCAHSYAPENTKFVRCSTTGPAHPYLWQLTLKIFHKNEYLAVKNLSQPWLRVTPIWEIAGTAKIKLKDYRRVYEYILLAIKKSFAWKTLVYKSFSYNAEML